MKTPLPTIHSKFINFMNQCYPTVSPGNRQWEAMELVWFSSLLDFMEVIKHDITKLDEVDGPNQLQTFEDEVVHWHKKNLKENIIPRILQEGMN